MLDKVFNRFYIMREGFGFCFRSNDTGSTWIGFHWYWQQIPLFDLIYCHQKCNTVHKYGFVILGLHLYVRVDHTRFDKNEENIWE